MTPARILFLGEADWGNLCNRVARSLNRHHDGETVARVWTLKPHPFGYQEDVIGEVPTPDLVEFARGVNWVIASGDGDYWHFDRMREKLGRDGLSPLVHLGTTHAGSAYRGTPDLYNEADARRGFEVRFIGLDSLRFAPGDPTVRPHLSPAPGRIGGNVGTGQVGPRPLRVAHAPSNRATKGTEAVLAAVRPLVDAGAIELDVIEGASYEQCRARLADCAILLDQFNPNVGGMGALAVEALSMGLAVVSDVRHVDGAAWDRLPAGRAPIVDVRDASAVAREVARLAGDLPLLRGTRLRSIAWAQRTVSAGGIAELWRLPTGLREAPVPPAPPPKISAPMIVKNEERGIAKALESLVGVVDEVVVVDTGSTDKTVDIVHAFAREWAKPRERWDDGANPLLTIASMMRPLRGPALRLLHHPWRDDFSEARNFAQDACTGDWCVILDGDEVLDPGDLRASIHAAPDHAIVALGVRLEGIIVQYRAHRRDRFRWEKPIHNQLTPRGPGQFAPSTATIKQSYEKGSTVRVERSKPMLLKYFEEHPEDPHAPNYLCKFAKLDGDWAEAKRWALKTIELMGPNSSYAGAWCIYVMAVYMQDGIAAAMAAVEQALERHPGYPDLWQIKANLCAVRWKQTMRSVAYQAISEMVMPQERLTAGWSSLAFQLEDDGDERSVTDNE